MYFHICLLGWLDANYTTQICRETVVMNETSLHKYIHFIYPPVNPPYHLSLTMEC